MARVVLFYSHAYGMPYREFSNFYEHRFAFQLPSWPAIKREYRGVVIPCAFSEKAIMLMKAALMGDAERFESIAEADTPMECKALGRQVRPFNDDLWRRHLDHVAFEVIRQKFTSSRSLGELLLSTDNALIAEASPVDRIWGIGLSIRDPKCYDPLSWQGENVLGVALMRVRSLLRGETIDLPPLPES